MAGGLSRVCSQGRAKQPAIDASDAALKKSSSVSKEMSDMLASFAFQDFFRSNKHPEPRVRRMQYHTGTDAPVGGAAEEVQGADGSIDIKGVEGILEFVQYVGPGHPSEQKGMSWLNGKMQLLERPATPRDVSEYMCVKITDEASEKAKARRARCPSTGSTVSRARFDSRSSSKGSSLGDSKTAAPSSPVLSPSRNSQLSMTSPAAVERARRPPSALKRASPAGNASGPSGPPPPTPGARSCSSLSLSAAFGGSASGTLKRAASSGALTMHDRVCWGDPLMATLGSPAGSASGSRPGSASRQRPRPPPLGRTAESCFSVTSVAAPMSLKAQAGPASSSAASSCDYERHVS
eukprot:TRINITY_DN30747_c0_g1_i1.p1 TRINITY_DN30747_c0_g1~~TRINITY_DN30747_c0_g1_i1.p1  ORF type:complete len:358 (+),score=59.35 TRINITY_DN30747_c0_g1_i1:26-1075(+)